MLNLLQRLQDISKYSIDGLREFTEHSVRYSARSLRDFVTDYWDAGAAVASGIVLSPMGNSFYGSLFGEYYTSLSLEQKLQIGGAVALISLIGAGVRDAGGVKNYVKDLLSAIKSGFSLKDPSPSGSNGSSVTRNFYAGLSTILIGIDSSAEGSTVEEALMKIFDGLSITGFIVMDRVRIRNTTNATTQLFGAMPH